MELQPPGSLRTKALMVKPHLVDTSPPQVPSCQPLNDNCRGLVHKDTFCQ